VAEYEELLQFHPGTSPLSFLPTTPLKTHPNSLTNSPPGQDVARLYTIRPLKGLDLAHLHDRLRTQRLSPVQSREIYETLAKYVRSYDEICLLLSVAPEQQAGLFYVALGLFHKDRDVRLMTADLLERVSEHEAGRHWWRALSRFEKLAWVRIKREAEGEGRGRGEREGEREGEGFGVGVDKRVS
jgi:hypothetical protein